LEIAATIHTSIPRFRVGTMDTEAEFLVKCFFAPNLPILPRDVGSGRVGCEHGLHSARSEPKLLWKQ
ncbi:MAG TPA: hypothetical protein VNO32_43650, partial [Candidatus Acidoferrum sp.]|nr:hypothetical protein [Candidatus Acidoferrum sp.]